jgi:hypothetical protein
MMRVLIRAGVPESLEFTVVPVPLRPHGNLYRTLVFILIIKFVSFRYRGDTSNTMKAGLWIRINFNPDTDPDTDPAFAFNPDPDSQSN